MEHMIKSDQLIQNVGWAKTIQITKIIHYCIRIYNLSFADDVIPIIDNLEAMEIKKEIDVINSKMGLKVNFTRTKIATNNNLTIRAQQIELVEKYIILGHEIWVERDIKIEIKVRWKKCLISTYCR